MGGDAQIRICAFLLTGGPHCLLGASGRRRQQDLQVADEPLSLDLSAIRFEIRSFWEGNLDQFEKYLHKLQTKETEQDDDE